MRQQVILLFLCLTVVTTAQTQSPYRKFATQQMHQQLVQQQPEWRTLEQSALQYLSNYRQVGEFPSVTIPIVFHILHRTAEERVTAAQITSQIQALNRDFGHETLGTETALEAENFLARRPDDTRIRFCMAAFEQSGTSRPAVFYHATNTAEWKLDFSIHFDSLGGADVILPQKYLNVWVVNLGEWAGYAQLPGLNPATDGIVIDYRFFGMTSTTTTPYNEGKTLTHLIGNYLGLYDLWNENFRCGDDYVADTPIHNAPNQGCPTYKHISTCSGNRVEMTMNFMDNTDDACMYLFTYGQLLRMAAVLSPAGPRKGLIKHDNPCFEGTVPTLTEQVEQRSNSVARSILDVQLRPNPASGVVHIAIEGMAATTPYKINVYNTLGQLLASYSYVGTNHLSLSCESWGKGIRFLELTTTNETVTKTLICE